VSEDRGRFFVVHLQKTAGVSLRARLRHHFGPAGVYPDASDGWSEERSAASIEAVASIDHLRERYRVRRNAIRVVIGHFPLFVTELLGGDFTTLTILREPVERTLSYLRHHRALTPEDADKSLEEIYADPLRFHGLAHNHMVKMFSLTGEEPGVSMLTRVEFTPERLEYAKERLATVSAIGVQERFEEFCEQLERGFGWDLGPPREMNKTGRADVSEEFRARIAEDNAMDIELYEFGCRLYEERGGEVSRARLRS
jgi:hypothetical protein